MSILTNNGRRIITRFMSIATEGNIPATPKNAAVKAVASNKKSAKQAFILKTPKGTKDWSDKDMVIRTAVFNHLTKIFQSHGGVTIDTPVFELREILAGKYGEDSKLIYNLEDRSNY